VLLCPRRERAALTTTTATTAMYTPNIKSIRQVNAEIAKLQTAITNAIYIADCYEMENLEKEILIFTEYLVEKGISLLKDTSKSLADIDESYGDKALIEQADTVGACALAVISDAM
jgi:hypothetical protein